MLYLVGDCETKENNCASSDVGPSSERNCQNCETVRPSSFFFSNLRADRPVFDVKVLLSWLPHPDRLWGLFTFVSTSTGAPEIED